jgi:hypothetical protein
MSHASELEVHENKQEDVYRDRARLPEAHRGGIREGRVCKVSVAGKNVLLEVRGIAGENNAVIRLDERTRNELGVRVNTRHTFTLREVGWIGQFRWAWNASDSASRIAARLGLLGIILGLFGLVLAVIPLLTDKH